MARIGETHAYRLATVGAMVGLLGSACTAMVPSPESEIVRIAADLELTGQGAQLGAIYRNALELRVEQINQQGLLRSNRQLELVVRDNRSDAAVAANNLREFVGDHSIAAIVSGACWECLQSMVDTINAEEVPTLSLAAADEVAEPVEERRSIFKVGPSVDHVAAALVDQLETGGARSVAIVATDDLYGKSGKLETEEAVKHAEQKIDIVVSKLLAPGSGELSSTTEEIVDYLPPPQPDEVSSFQQRRGPDAVVAWGLAPFGVEFAESLHGAGYEGDLFLDPAAADNLFMTGAASEALTGATMIFTETLVIDEVVATSPAKVNRRNWFNDYTARYGTYHAPASLAADAIQLIVAAVNQVDSIDRAAIRTSLESMQLDGLTGPLRMTPENHAGLLPQALAAVTVRDDRWRLSG